MGRGQRRARPRRLRPGRPHASEAIAAAWTKVYRDSERWFELYQLAEKLVDIDDALAGWRHKHVLTVTRIIGNKPGTGGSAGAAYLQSTLSKRAFPELWSLRTGLVSFKHLFSRALDAAPERLHVAAHSHHLWPDASFAGQVEAWDDAARLADHKWDRVMGEVWPEAQAHVAGELGTGDAGRDRVRGQHPRFPHPARRGGAARAIRGGCGC